MTSKNYYISPFLLNLILALSVWTSPALAGPIVLVAGSTLSNTGAYLSVVELPEPNGEDGGLSKAPQEIAFFPGIASAGVNQSVAVGTDPVTGHKKAFVLAKLVQPGPLVYRIDSYNISTLTQESSITLPAGDSFENLAISPDKARLLTINQQTAQAYFLDIDYNNFSQSTITVKDLFYFGASILSGTKMTFAPDGTALILEGNVLLSGTIIQNSVATEISPDMSMSRKCPSVPGMRLLQLPAVHQ